MDLGDPAQWNGYSYATNDPVTFSDPSGLLQCYGHQEGDLCPGNQSGPWAPLDDDAREDYFGDGNGNRNPDNSHTGKPGSKPPSTFQDYPTYPNGVRIQVTDEAVIIYIPGTAPYRPALTPTPSPPPSTNSSAPDSKTRKADTPTSPHHTLSASPAKNSPAPEPAAAASARPCPPTT